MAGLPAVGILAGGESRRFGADKAWAEIDGEPAIVRLVRAVRAQHAGEILISGRAPLARYAALGCTVVTDRLGAGPLAGVHALLEIVRSPWLIVLPVDLVDFPAGWLSHWMSARHAVTPDVPALVLADDQERWHPVHALLHRSLAHTAARALEAGRWGLGDFLRQVDAMPLRLPLPPTFNSQAELDALRAESARTLSSGG